MTGVKNAVQAQCAELLPGQNYLLCPVTGGKQRGPTDGAAPREHLRAGASLSKKEKRRLTQELQRGAGDVARKKQKRF